MINDVTGKTINGFFVIGDSGKRYNGKNVLWLVRCPYCSSQKTMQLANIKKCKSCGCRKVDLHRKHKNVWKGCGEIGGTYWHQVKDNAKRRKLSLTISLDYAWKLFLKQSRRCALSGEKLCFRTRCQSKDGTASLDRIDSNLGYVKGNVQWVHKHINVMKNRFPAEDFIEWCDKISVYRRKKMISEQRRQQLGKITKNAFPDFGLKVGAVRGKDLVHNGGWYNGVGEKIGWGDLAVEDIKKNQD